MLRLSMPLISVHDLPAAIRSRSRSSSSGVQRILGITQSFSSLEPELDQTAHKLILSVIHGGCSALLRYLIFDVANVNLERRQPS